MKKSKYRHQKCVPQCRAQLRLLCFVMSGCFTQRPCDKCTRDVISMYSPNKSYPVWCYECWFADDWDATEYGQGYDLARPFLEQFQEVYDKVPKLRSYMCEA